MKYTKYLSILLLSSIAFYSCSNEDEDIAGGIGKPVEVQFTSTVDGKVTTTYASDATWSANDKIGLFMKKNSQILSAANIVSNADNVIYSTTGSGNFTAVNDADKIYYPTDGSAVDFIAYYPQTAPLTNYIYEIDVEDQSNQEAIDLLYSNNSKGLGSNNPTSRLDFTHQLAKLTFNITAGDGVSDLSGIDITITGMPTKASFELAEGKLTVDAGSVKDIVAKKNANGSKVQALIIPVTAGTYAFKIAINGKSFSHKLENKVFAKGQEYIYNITIKDGGSTVTPGYKGWAETPRFSPKTDLQYVSHNYDTKNRNYSLLFDQKNRVALWVAYPLHAMHMGSGRPEAWVADPKINPSFQPYLKSSWATPKNCNRGHQIANSDRNGITYAAQQTFYFSNMTLQDTDMNGKIWNKLETKVQAWAKTGVDTLYVVSGVILSTPQTPNITYGTDKQGTKAAMPQFFYKAISQKKKDGKVYTIGYRIPNLSSVANNNFENYRITVEKLEQETGFTFFQGVDAEAKKTIVENQWN